MADEPKSSKELPRLHSKALRPTSAMSRNDSSTALPRVSRGESRMSLRGIVRGATTNFGGTGRVGTLTPQQAAALAQFRLAIERERLIPPDDSLGADDATLLRFLRARNFKVDQSLAMVKAAQEWRTHVCDIGMDKLYEEVIDPFDYPSREEVFKYWPLYFHGVSKGGLPMNMQHFGKIDLKALYKHVDKDQHWRAVVANCEALPRECMPACSEAAGKPIEGAFCVVDLKGFSLFQFWGFKPMAQRLFQISQDFFPETMGRVLVINSPAGFATIWKAIKPWLAPATVTKINILGSDYQKVLFDLVDRDQLPKVFGGTCECPGGCMLNSPGPWKEARKKMGVEAARKGPARRGVGTASANETDFKDESVRDATKALANGSAKPEDQPTSSPKPDANGETPEANGEKPEAPAAAVAAAAESQKVEAQKVETNPASKGETSISSPKPSETSHAAANKSHESHHGKHHAASGSPKAHAQANGHHVDPRRKSMPGQGHVIKRQTSHGVERVLLEAEDDR